jgi:hypothetical protein
MTRNNYLMLAAALFLVGCRHNTLIDRSLIFSTHTSFGIEVSVSPSETDSPAKLLIGYKRTEGVLNPVYYNLDKDGKGPSTRSVRDFYLNDAYSVLAKFEGTATSSGGATSQTTVTAAKSDTKDASGNLSATVQGGMTLSQWFATGEAAKILARYGGGALSDNPGVAAAVSAGAAQQAFTEHLIGLSGDVRGTFFTQVNGLLTSIKTPEATARQAALNAGAAKVIARVNIDIPAEYTYDPNATPKKTLTADPPAPVTGANAKSPFTAAVGRLMALENSIDALREAAKQKEADIKVIENVPAAQIGGYVTEGQKTAHYFIVTLADYEKKKNELAKELASLPEFRAAATFVAEYLGLKE